MLRPPLGSEDGENARAAAHVEHFKTLHLVVEQALKHLCRGLMMPCAERHLRIDGNVIVGRWNVFMESRSHYAAGVIGRTDDERLKVVFLPLFIPILVLGRHLFVVDFDIGQGKSGQRCVEGGLIVKPRLNVGFVLVALGFVGKDGGFGKSIFEGDAGAVKLIGVDETLKTDFGQDGTQHIADGFAGRGGGKGKFEVLHS